MTAASNDGPRPTFDEFLRLCSKSVSQLGLDVAKGFNKSLACSIYVADVLVDPRHLSGHLSRTNP